MQNEILVPSILGVKEFSKKHQAFSYSALRNHIFNKEQNGLDDFKVIKQIKRRVYIDEQAFFKWLDYQTQLANRGC